MSEDISDVAPSVEPVKARFVVVRNDDRGSHRWLVDDEAKGSAECLYPVGRLDAQLATLLVKVQRDDNARLPLPAPGHC